MNPNEPVALSANTTAPGSGWVELQDLCVVSFRGSEARNFLGRQLTCDMQRSASEVTVFGAWLTAKGRVFALLRIIQRAPDRFDAVVCRQLAEGLIGRMRLFVMRDDVSIDLDQQQSIFGLWGRCTATFTNAGTNDDEQPVDRDASNLVVTPPVTISLSSTPALAMAVGTSDTLRLALGEHAPLQGEASQWRRLCIEAGLPQLEPATQETFIPQMINLDRLDAVSFSKGCYPGQEIVARTQHLGRIKRRMFIARAPSREIQGDVQPGDVIVGNKGEDIGGRVLCVERGALDTVLLAVLPLGSDSLIPSVRIHDASGPRLAVSAPPYSLADTPDKPPA